MKESLKCLEAEYAKIETVFPLSVDTEEELVMLVEMAAWKQQLYKRIQDLKKTKQDE